MIIPVLRYVLSISTVSMHFMPIKHFQLSRDISVHQWATFFFFFTAMATHASSAVQFQETVCFALLKGKTFKESSFILSAEQPNVNQINTETSSNNLG